MARTKAERNSYARDRRDKRKALLIEHFGSKCADCGGSFHPCCYDFHHRDPSNKSFEIAPRMDGNWETIKSEAEKCDMLCSNCHRIRHYKEESRGDVKYGVKLTM